MIYPPKIELPSKESEWKCEIAPDSITITDSYYKCRFCDNSVPLLGEICPKCLPPYQAGEQAGKEEILKRVSQEMRQVLRELGIKL